MDRTELRLHVRLLGDQFRADIVAAMEAAADAGLPEAEVLGIVREQLGQSALRTEGVA